MNFECRLRTILFVLWLSSWTGLSVCSIAQAQEPPVSPDGAGERLSLQLQGMDIVEVLKILSEQTGVSLVAGRNVSGRVNLFLQDVEPWEALEVVLAANELAYERHGEILNIMTRRDYELIHGMPYEDRRIFQSVSPQYAKVANLARALIQIKSDVGRVIADEASNTLILVDIPARVEEMTTMIHRMDLPVQTKIFSLDYSPVEQMQQVLQEVLTPGVGTLSVNERTRQLVVTDYPDVMNRIAQMVASFDERATQVLIETKIFQVTLSDKFQLGIDWEVLARENITLKGLGALNLTSGGSLKIAQAALENPGDYTVLIEALRTYGDTQILSEPRLTVVNRQEAKILVGSKEPFVTRSVSQSGSGTAITSETVTFLDVGVSLLVTPTIARDGFIQMEVLPEISSKTGVVVTSEGNEIPIIETAEAETILQVEDGGTVILGGLIKDEESVNQQRIPLLGDLPLVGALFRSTRETTKKTELVIFLTPRIVSGKKSDSPVPTTLHVDSPS